ncbi:MAG: DAHL domain-containing protein [Cyanobacteria bacterium J06650_10]
MRFSCSRLQFSRLRFSRLRFSKLSKLYGALLFGCLLLLLTGLFRQTQVHNINQHYQIVEQLRALERSHLIIKADALNSRAAVFHNYDSITADNAAFEQHFKALSHAISQLPKPDLTLREKLNEIDTQMATRNLQLEDFKSENAILKNSTAYFPMSVATTTAQLNIQLSAEDQTQPVTALLQNLLQLILMYCLDNALADPSEIQQLIDQIASPPITDNVLRHAEAILRLQGEVNQFISVLSSETIDTAIHDLTRAYDNYHRQVTQTKNHYRLALFTVAVMLVGYSSYLAWVKQNTRILKAVNLRLSDVVNEKTQALKEALTQLKHSQAQLVQSEKLSGLGQLSAGIAHEINNPISFIHGNIQANTHYSQDCLELISLYEKHYPEPVEEIREFTEDIELDFLKKDWKNLLNSMKTGTKRVQKIVESLRNFSRLDEAQHKPVDLHKGIDSSLLLLNHRLCQTTGKTTGKTTQQPIKVTKQYGELPLVYCYASEINQVFINLIENAIDALRAKTEALQAKTTEPQPHLTIATYTEAEHAVIKITDNGVGIPKVNQGKIFDPFFTTKPVGQGTGLGLTTSYQAIVEAHQGKIAVTSIPGEGTTFRVELPLNANTASASVEEAA